MATLSGAAAEDLAPPVTTITIAADRTVTLTATDGDGSGVHQILYSTEAQPVHYQVYTAPFPLGNASHVTAVATDLAGNTEYPPAEVTGATLYLPLVVR